MNLIEYLRVLRRRWWVLVLAAVLGIGAAVGLTLLEQKRYASTIQMVVSGSSSLGAADEITQHALASQRALLFAQISPKDPVVEAATKSAVEANPGAAIESSHISVSAKGPTASTSDALRTQSPFFTVTVTADDPLAAQLVAQAFPGVLPDQYATLNKVPQSEASDLLTVLAPASYSGSPVSPKPLLNGALGLIAGLLLGVGIVALWEVLDTTLRDSADVRRESDLQILGIVPREFADERLPALTRPHSRRSEAYRKVRTALEFSGDDQAPRVIAVTSPGQGDGKSSTSANLALLMARAAVREGRQVVLVDADLRRPTIHNYFNTNAERGLSDVLTGRIPLAGALQQLPGEQLVVLSCGSIPDNPSELLDSTAMTQLLRDLSSWFSLVIIDTPPVLAVADALLVAAHADGVVLVTRMRRTTRLALNRALESLADVKARVLGLVVNATVEPESKRYGYGYGYKGYASPERVAGGAAFTGDGDRKPKGRRRERQDDTAPVGPPVANGDSVVR